jgi:hypothetical protein
MEVVIEDLQTDQRIPGGIPFGKGMRFTSEGIEPITECAVDSLDVNGSRFGNDFAQYSANLNGEQLAMLITMLNGLRQTHISRYPKLWASQFP